jgi:hypothetical protein
MKTHIVIDLNYKEKEGNKTFIGTLQECNDWITLIGQGSYEVRPMTQEELKINNPQLLTD